MSEAAYMRLRGWGWYEIADVLEVPATKIRLAVMKEFEDEWLEMEVALWLHKVAIKRGLNKMSDWEVHIEYRPDRVTTYAYILRRSGKDIEFITKGGLEHRILPQGASKDENIHFAQFEDMHIASLFVQALEERGVKPPQQSYIEGRLEATQDHLQDLRKLVPKLRTKQDE